MGLFQQTILKKHIESLNSEIINQKWELFQAHFHNTTIQQNIRNSKEEQYQEGFFRDLFVNIFGYTLNPAENFNLTTELKNITNSKKADGAIIVNEKALAVIELKGTDTTDLSKIESQAFGYKSNQPGCNYVITSNFEKLRFYIDNTTQFEEFNLFTLDKKSFELLYCCLDWENVSKNVPVNLLNQSVSKESAITKQLYKDYSDFKRSLFENLVELNSQYDKLELFKKTQKLLDRFLFIFFAEDRLLLPTNLIRRINHEWENLQKKRIPVSLYDRYKIYFNDLNEGSTVTLPAFGKKTGEVIEETHDIFAYNGGLFKPDEFLENLKIDDQLLYNYTLKLSDYDFQSEVDVNILGHIFENSLNEIDEIKSEIEGKEVDKTKTKRKKDGVFYTPKYITKYIVDNTVGKLCAEKKAEIKLEEEKYFTDKNLQTKTKKALLDKLTTYKEWLLQLTICDPACGSGAFLNQALEFLIAEHRYIDELQAKLMGDSLVLSDVETSILENNIYGVDLNDESVEIAKLSLWLRTAQKGRKLNSLNNNIKCGNSLIDDPEIAGDKAFSWEKEFPEVFAKGGFDVIIGNPPYVQYNNEFYLNYFTNKCGDLYALFFEKGLNILKEKGVFSFITPSLFIKGMRYESLRNYLLKNSKIIEIRDLGDNVFQDVQMPTAVSILIKTYFQDQKWDEYIDNNTLIKKIEKNSIPISDILKIMRGLEIGKDKVQNIINSNCIDFLTGENIYRYGIKSKSYIDNDIYQKFKKDNTFFVGKRLIIRETGSRLTVLYIEDFDIQQNRSLYSLKLISDNSKFSLKYILALLNSSTLQFYYKSKFTVNTDVFPKIRIGQVKELPIKNLKNELQRPFIFKAESMMFLNKDFQQITQKFSTYFSSQYNLEKLSGKLEKWHELTFVDFIKELNKAIKGVKGTPLTKKDEFEWMDLFEENKKKALEIKAEIDKTDKEIDQMVYELYGLTEEEIKIVEGE